jgi:hypothetical protein
MTMTLPSGGSAWAGLAAPGPAGHGACPRGLAAPGGQETALAGTAGADGAGPGLLELAGDEARLPAGSKLADERAAARRCFVILDGQATVERAGARCRDLGRGDFVGLIGADGSPLPPVGVTVRLETSARVLVIDPVRLATLIGAHPEYAAEWQYLSERQGLSSRLGRPGTADGAGGGPAPPWRLSGTGPPPAPSAT